MSGITQDQAQTALDAWIAADLAVSRGQSYTIGGRSLTRADANVITDKIKFYSGLVAEIGRGGSGTVRRALPRDL